MIKKFQTPSGAITLPGQLWQTPGYNAPGWYNQNKLRKYEEEVKKKRTPEQRRKAFVSPPKINTTLRQDNTRAIPSDVVKSQNYKVKPSSTYEPDELSNEKNWRYFWTTDQISKKGGGVRSSEPTINTTEQAGVLSAPHKVLQAFDNANGWLGAAAGQVLGTIAGNRTPKFHLNETSGEHGSATTKFFDSLYSNAGFKQPDKPLGQVVDLGLRVAPYYIPKYGQVLFVDDIIRGFSNPESTTEDYLTSALFTLPFFKRGLPLIKGVAPRIQKFITKYPKTSKVIDKTTDHVMWAPFVYGLGKTEWDAYQMANAYGMSFPKYVGNRFSTVWNQTFNQNNPWYTTDEEEKERERKAAVILEKLAQQQQ